jgi:hypothetical protein
MPFVVFLWPFCAFYRHLVCFVALGMYFSILVCYTHKNMATLVEAVD